jgi:prepilin-type N-terminal cleavage/methylation domain-containing protein
MMYGGTGRRDTAGGRPPGFTLLEVLVALALLGIAGVVVFQLFSAGTRNIKLSEDYVNAEVRAEARMREVLDLGVQTTGAWSEMTTDGYRIDVEVADALQERTAELPVRLVEVSLTIRWKRQTGKKSLTLKTMKMLNREMKTTVPGHV